jgi:hypothetical protein
MPTRHVDEINTMPEARDGFSQSLVPTQSAARIVPVDAASWTFGSDSAASLATRFVASRSPRQRRRTRRFSPLDRTRWWLLRPGHIEFLLWLLGSVLLFSITFLLLLATVLSLMVPGRPTSGNLPSSANPATSLPTPASGVLHVALAGKAELLPGGEFYLAGRGFRPRSQVVFLLDGRWPLLDQQGHAASVSTGADGRFAVNLWLGQGSNWSAGAHLLMAREVDNGHSTAIAITITAALPAVNNPGGQNTPAPPVYPTPTLPKPTATSVQPTSTPRSPTPTPGIPPTASPAGTPGGNPTPGSSNLGNALNTHSGNSFWERVSHINPLIWSIGSCYLLSLILMGLAGLLRRRR